MNNYFVKYEHHEENHDNCFDYNNEELLFS